MAKSSQDSVVESEQQLLETAQKAVSQSNWIVGECATKWTRKYARGRTDADFGLLVGLTGDQVYQRRRVWESFSDVYQNYTLKWSHFYVALNWDDAPECLQWAEENSASVAEMRAWRRAMHGEDLTQPTTDDWGNELTIDIDQPVATEVRDPSEFGGSDTPSTSGTASGATSDSEQNTVTAVAREDYSPFRKGAGAPAPKSEGGEVAVIEKPRQSPDQVLKRIVTTLERVNKTLSSDVLSSTGEDSDKLLKRLRTVVGDLAARVAEMPD